MGKTYNGAERLQIKRKANIHNKIKGTHLKNAIIKHGKNAFKTERIDTAYSLKELNERERYWVKEYDSMNPKKGYNMTEGGDFGTLRSEILCDPEYREKQRSGTRRALKKLYEDPEIRAKHRINTSNAISEKWKDPNYQEKQEKAKEKIGNATREKFRNPEFKKKHREATHKAMEKVVNDPKFRENMSIAAKKMWQNHEYQEKHHRSMEYVYINPNYIKSQKESHCNPKYLEQQSKIGKERFLSPKFCEKHSRSTSKGMEAKWKDPDYIKKQAIAKKELGRKRLKEIRDKRDFLREVKNNVSKKNLLEKYDMGHNALNRRIQEIFGPNGPKNYKQLKEHLIDKDVEDVLKEKEN